jgi:hypothetical protein
MDYIFRYKNWHAFKTMRPAHGECDDEVKDCPFIVQIVKINLGTGSVKLKKEVTAFCPACKKKVVFWVAFDT